MARKSFNPFKMWGSYVGAIIIPIVVYFINSSQIDKCNVIDFPTGVCIGLAWYLPLVLSIPLGFLIGWGIHSLVRALRR